MSSRFLPLMAALLAGAAYTQTARAQDESEATEAPAEGSEESQESPAAEEKPAATESEAAASDTSPVEKEGVTYQFVGLRYRGLVVPKFVLGLFADGGTTVYAHNFGPEFIIRKDNFEYNLSATYTSYAFDATPFKSSSDAEDAWELVESHIKVLYLGADFLWSHPFDQKLALNYGFGAALGIVWGDLNRVQAYQDANGEYQPCVGPNNPVTPEGYCGNDNDHYGDYTEPSWTGGGSKPILTLWLAGQVGLRYKPHKNFQARLDAGIALGHVFFGLGADYGL